MDAASVKPSTGSPTPTITAPANTTGAASAAAGTGEVAGMAGTGGKDFGVRIELSVSYLQRTSVLTNTMRHLPLSMHETWLATVYQSEWTW